MNQTLRPLFLSFETAKPIMTFKLFKPQTNRGFRFCKNTFLAISIKNKAAKKIMPQEKKIKISYGIRIFILILDYSDEIIYSTFV